jgi:UbiD family decarboxylase
MAFRDFRDFLAVAEQRGKLKRVGQTVDRMWEPASLAKWMFQALPEDDRFGLMFDDVAGSEFPLVTGALGASVHTYAMALGVEPDGINDVWLEALLNPVEPRVVEAAPCQEVVRLGKDARLGDLPIPVWTPGKDVGPYITTITVNRRMDDGAQNMGVYRTMVRDDHSVVVNLNPGRQGYIYCRTWFDQGKPAPIAWVVATEPCVHLATVANLPIGVDEITVAGGLKGEPVDLVKCKTSDILVPANAEIIIEGEVLPGEMADEGPFGEFAGYMGPVAPKPVARITAITHRKGAIYYGYTSQMPPSESTVIQSLSNAPVLLKQLRHDLGEKTVRDVFIDLTFGGLLAHGIVAMKPMVPGHAKKIGRILADTTPLKRITIVDEDIDVRDPLHVEWAMNSHYNPVRDTVIIDDVFFPMGMDPSVRVDATEMGSKIVIDATQTVDAGELSLPPREIMDKALEVWREAGLPDFEIPKRLQSRLDRS